MRTLLTALAFVSLAVVGAAQGDNATPVPTTPPAAPTDTTTTLAAIPPVFIAQQAADQMLASNLIGQAVYNTTGDNLGKVTDFAVGKDGGVKAVVLGVGGFLGIGQKSIAVPFAALTQDTDDNGNIVLDLDTTKEALDAAPEFATLALIKQKQLEQEQDSAMINTAPSAPVQ